MKKSPIQIGSRSTKLQKPMIGAKGKLRNQSESPFHRYEKNSGFGVEDLLSDEEIKEDF
jgi:hypothetical protein